MAVSFIVGPQQALHHSIHCNIIILWLLDKICVVSNIKHTVILAVFAASVVTKMLTNLRYKLYLWLSRLFLVHNMALHYSIHWHIIIIWLLCSMHSKDTISDKSCCVNNRHTVILGVFGVSVLAKGSLFWF